MPSAAQRRGPVGKGKRKIWCVQVLFYVKACPSDKWKSLKEGRVTEHLRKLDILKFMGSNGMNP